jgi:hypothetical protein
VQREDKLSKCNINYSDSSIIDSLSVYLKQQQREVPSTLLPMNSQQSMINKPFANPYIFTFIELYLVNLVAQLRVDSDLEVRVILRYELVVVLIIYVLPLESLKH